MATLVEADLVLETTTTTGTGTLTLLGAVTGYRAWSVVGNANKGVYRAWAVDANGVPTGDWELGVGTYTSSGTTLSRDTIIKSSNSNAAVSFAAGTKRVALVKPAESSLYIPFHLLFDLTGSADSATAFQLAEDQLHAAGGGVLKLPGGTIKLGSKITCYTDVAIHGATYGATILKSSAAVIMLEADRAVSNLDGFELRDITLDGNSTGTTGLHVKEFYNWVLRHVFVKNFTTGIHFEGAGEADLYDCIVYNNGTGLKGTATASYAPNLVNISGGDIINNSTWAVNWDAGSMVNFFGVDFENNGTAANDSTGVIIYTNGSPNSEGIGINLNGCWGEHNKGYAFLKLGAPTNHDCRSIMQGCLSIANDGNLKYGVYVDGSGNRNRLLTQACTIASNSISDVKLSASGAYWERGPTTAASVDTASGTVTTWG